MGKSASNWPMLLCSELILFKTQHSEQIGRILDAGSSSPSAGQNTSTSPGLEAYLAKCLIDTIEKNGHEMLCDNYTLVAILLDLYIKCGTFRLLLNEHAARFHELLVTCLNRSFGVSTSVERGFRQLSTGSGDGDGGGDSVNNSEGHSEDSEIDDFSLFTQPEQINLMMSLQKSQYIEILLDFIFCFLYYNRRVSSYSFFFLFFLLGRRDVFNDHFYSYGNIIVMIG